MQHSACNCWFLFYFIFFCNFRFECIPEILLENDPNGMKCKSCEHLNTKFHNLTPRLDENNDLWFKGKKYVVGDGVMLLPKSFDLAIRQKKGMIILSHFFREIIFTEIFMSVV